MIRNGFNREVETKPLSFHSNCKGVSLEMGKCRAVRDFPTDPGFVVSNRPISINERVIIRQTAVTLGYEGTLFFGVTSVDPATSDIDHKISMNGGENAWGDFLPTRFVYQGGLVQFSITNDGNITYSINEVDKGTLLSGVSTGGSLWAIFGLNGTAQSIEFVNPMHLTRAVVAPSVRLDAAQAAKPEATLPAVVSSRVAPVPKPRTTLPSRGVEQTPPTLASTRCLEPPSRARALPRQSLLERSCSVQSLAAAFEGARLRDESPRPVLRSSGGNGVGTPQRSRHVVPPSPTPVPSRPSLADRCAALPARVAPSRIAESPAPTPAYLRPSLADCTVTIGAVDVAPSRRAESPAPTPASPRPSLVDGTSAVWAASALRRRTESPALTPSAPRPSLVDRNTTVEAARVAASRRAESPAPIRTAFETARMAVSRRAESPAPTLRSPLPSLGASPARPTVKRTESHHSLLPPTPTRPSPRPSLTVSARSVDFQAAAARIGATLKMGALSPGTRAPLPRAWTTAAAREEAESAPLIRLSSDGVVGPSPPPAPMADYPVPANSLATDSGMSGPSVQRLYPCLAFAAEEESQLAQPFDVLPSAPPESPPVSPEARARSIPTRPAPPPPSAAPCARQERFQSKPVVEHIYDEPFAVPDSNGNFAGVDQYESQKECVICLGAVPNGVLYDCGHLYACYECAVKIKEEKGVCSICRKPIKEVIKTYSC